MPNPGYGIEQGLVFIKADYFSLSYAFAMNDVLLRNPVIYVLHPMTEQARQDLAPHFGHLACYEFRKKPNSPTPALIPCN